MKTLCRIAEWHQFPWQPILYYCVIPTGDCNIDCHMDHTCPKLYLLWLNFPTVTAEGRHNENCSGHWFLFSLFFVFMWWPFLLSDGATIGVSRPDLSVSHTRVVCPRPNNLGQIVIIMQSSNWLSSGLYVNIVNYSGNYEWRLSPFCLLHRNIKIMSGETAQNDRDNVFTSIVTTHKHILIFLTSNPMD